MTSRTRAIDLNADLGEGFPWDDALLGLVTSASVSCGAHSSSPEAGRNAIAIGRDRGVVLGAHPGYADRANFGRKPRSVSTDEVASLVIEQTLSLCELAKSEGAVIRYIKPHGALYNQAMKEEVIARGLARAAGSLSLPLLGQPSSMLESLCREHKVGFYREGFPERGYAADGSLLPRGTPGAVLDDLAAIERQIEWLFSEPIDTLCIHGDAEHAIAVASAVRTIAQKHDIIIRSFLEP